MCYDLYDYRTTEICFVDPINDNCHTKTKIECFLKFHKSSYSLDSPVLFNEFRYTDNLKYVSIILRLRRIYLK